MKLTLSKNKRFNSIILVISFLFAVLGIFFSINNQEMIKKAEQSEVSYILKAYAEAQLIYFEDYKKFSSDRNLLGINSTSGRVVIYLNEKEIPFHIRTQIEDNSVPYVGSNSFRILAIFYNNKQKPEVWTINNFREVLHSGHITLD